MALSSTEAGSTSQSVQDTESASDVALSRHSDSSDQEENDDGRNKLTEKWLLKFFSNDWKHYYRTFELNEKLYLHFKGFEKIRCMEKFPHLKTLYFEGNGLSEISGLETNSELRCLYIHENCVQKMEGLDGLTSLSNLNVSDNLISTVEGIGNLTQLDCLYLQRNRIGRNGIDDLRGLLECPSLTTIDLQNNKIDDEEALEEIFVHMPNLKVLYLQGNGITSKIRNYRKTVIDRIPSLKYLDDRPVFEDDRRNAEAFARGGMEEERKERDIIQQEKRDKDDKNRNAFKEMIRKAREEKRLADEKAAAENPDLVAEPASANPGADHGPAFDVDETEEKKADDNDLPPELETVDDDKRKAENEALDQEGKQKKQMYEQLRKTSEAAADDDSEEDEGCTVTEVVDEPAAKVTEVPEVQARPAGHVDQMTMMADMIKGVDAEAEPEFVSTLEELD